MFKKSLLLFFSLLTVVTLSAREKYNFNSDWRLKVGDFTTARSVSYNDSDWTKVTLPHAFNEDEAFAVEIRELTDTVMWYRKNFVLPKSVKGKKVFIEFEGARQGVDLYVNGRYVGQHENGVMAFGFDLTDFVKPGKNVIAVRVDNNWDYADRTTGVKYQWSNNNFNANYGGLQKNVWLHITDKVYQTLPLYSNLQTTGVYVYPSNMDIQGHSADVNVESEVSNESGKAADVALQVRVLDMEGRTVAEFGSEAQKVQAGDKAVLKASAAVSGLHFWSWGYGYLYDVRTSLKVNGAVSDEMSTRTGFRKTRFAEGKIWLNDRVIQMHGFAQRTSNEWPALGMSVPAWMSDYSNGKIVEAGGNLVRWMHITPWKQDVESCDRVGLIEAMPAGDAESDVTGTQWEQRRALMRDAIIYNRNNPSILFYESGNESISREHMLEMRDIKDKYDFYGGRAIGSREMLDIREAEYGGEMLYVNLSSHTPFWAMEYCRDEALRLNRDAYSYPFHEEGDGPKLMWSASRNMMMPGNTAPYNHNQDEFAAEHVRRWYDYWRDRAGSGNKVSSGGVNIIFSDSNTHFRGAQNYRRSGVVDPLRIEKETFYGHQVMWTGWVDVESPGIYIVGHWNYDKGTVKPVYVISNTETVELYLNGKKLEGGVKESGFLFTYKDVAYEPGKLEAVGYNAGNEAARYTVETVGEPAALKLTSIADPSGWKADGADVALVQIEVVDAQGRRCPLANDMIHYELEGPAEWRGGIATGDERNYILAKDFPVECGVNRAIIRSTTTPGTVTLKASAKGLPEASISLETEEFKTVGGLSEYIPGDHLASNLKRGETPKGQSYSDRAVAVGVASIEAGANQDQADNCIDDNELSEWGNDGKLETAWITFNFDRAAQVDDICIKMSGWRMSSYPIQVLAGDKVVWEGVTERTLGYSHIMIEPVMSRSLTIKMKAASTNEDAFSGIVELAKPDPQQMMGPPPGASSFDLKIVEVEFRETLK